MFLIEVIPVSRGIGSELLSYYSKDPLSPGTVVSVELRSRLIPALVMSQKNLAEARSEIRSASFELKKIRSTSAHRIIFPQALEAAQETAKFFSATTGAILNHIIPKAVLENAQALSEQTPASSAGSPSPEKYILQSDDDDRFTHYKRIVREAFARSTSVYICVPTARDASRLRDIISKGIEEYTLTLHGSLKGKEMVALWKRSGEITHPILIIGTGLFLTIPRTDLKTIVLEKEHSSGYRTQSRPFLDFRHFAEVYAAKIGARLVFGDSLLRVETLWRSEEHELSELAPTKFRSLTKSKQMIIDMRVYRKEAGSQFQILSNELKDALKLCDKELKKMIIFVTRRGLASETVCGDCGTIVACHHCKSPVVLHKSTAGADSNFFLCHVCGERRSAHEKCVICTSWKLVPLGIGIERVEDEIAKLVPSLPCLRLDSDTAKTSAGAERIVKKFSEATKGVLIGTEMLLHQTIEPVDTSAIVSLDSLFAVPDFRIHEKIVHLILAVRALSKETFLLQTRNPEEELLQDAITGHLANFYRREIALREQFHYPPFSTLIKVTVEGSKDSATAIFEHLIESIKPQSVSVFPAFVKTGPKRHALHGLIKAPRKDWPDKKLGDVLMQLPRNSTVNINPESVF